MLALTTISTGTKIRMVKEPDEAEVRGSSLTLVIEEIHEDCGEVTAYHPNHDEAGEQRASIKALTKAMEQHDKITIDRP